MKKIRSLGTMAENVVFNNFYVTKVINFANLPKVGFIKIVYPLKSATHWLLKTKQHPLSTLKNFFDFLHKLMGKEVCRMETQKETFF